MSIIERPINQEIPEGVRLLSFDGGDLRAVSQLIILEEVMRRAQWDRKSPKPILPCDYFQMIGGVGASGILVVMLVVLRMGIEETIEQFIQIWNLVFADASLDRSERSTKLEAVIKELLKRRGVDESRRMDDGIQVDHRCKAFVCAIPGSNLGICEKFRTYKSKETSINPTIVEAILATCAVPTLFLPVNIDSIGCQLSYVSGAYNFNNPSVETIKEACQYFGPDQRVACMLSLGCGQNAFIRLSQAIEMTVTSLVNDFACDCERVDRDLGWRVGDSGVYYRLSVNRILESGDSFGASIIGEIISCTKGYLEHPETTAKITKCVQASQAIGGVTLRNISGLNEPKTTSIHGLPSLSEYFVERPALIKTMAQCLFQLGPSTQRRMVLSGLGGIGKTQATVSFLLQYLARFRHVFFIDGSSEQSIESGLVAKVKSLGETYSRSSASEALEVLSDPDYEITRDWAIIYDNVDDPKINIGRYFPSCAFGTIVITTRNPNLGILAPKGHIKLEIMSEEEAAEVLLRLAIDPSREPTEAEMKEAHEIGKVLGYLPLALAQAGYFIRVHDCLYKFRERLRRRRPGILGRPAEYQLDAHVGFYAILDLTRPHLTAGAQHFMSILGFVNYTGFPIILLYRAAARGFAFEPFQLMDRPPSFQDTIRLLYTAFRPQEDWDEQDVDDLVAELEKHSLVTRMITFKVTTLRLHPLVHSWTRDRLQPAETGIYQAAATRLLVCGTGKDDEDIYEFLNPHVSVAFDRLGQLHVNDQVGLATILAHQGHLQAAIEIWEGAQERTRRMYGRDDLRSTEADLQLAALDWYSNVPEKKVMARRLEREVVDIRKRVLGLEHPDTLRAIVQQACRETQTYSPKDLPIKHAWVATFPVSLEVAEETLRDALEAWERQPGDNWEGILLTKENLATVCKTEEAIDLYTEVVQARMERNGADHGTTLKAMERLSQKYAIHRFRIPDGSPILGPVTATWRSIVTARIQSRGLEHPDTLDALGNLAGFYKLRGLYGDSVHLWKEIASLRHALQGADHEDTLSAITHVALIYARCGHFAESAVHWKRIEYSKTKVLGPYHVDTLHALQEVAMMYTEAKQYSKAVEQGKKILYAFREEFGPGHESTLKAMAGLARSYQSAEMHTESEAQWTEVVRVIKEGHGSHYEGIIDAKRQLASIYAWAGKPADAEREWRELVHSVRDKWGPKHQNTLKEMRSMAEMCRGAAGNTTAIALWREIVQVTTESLGPAQKDTLDSMKALANAYQRGALYTEAAVQWKEVVDVTKEAYGHSHPDTSEAICELIDFCQRNEEICVLAILIEMVEEMVEAGDFDCPTDFLRESLATLNLRLDEMKVKADEADEMQSLQVVTYVSS